MEYYLIIQTGEAKGRSVKVDKDNFSIGRASKSMGNVDLHFNSLAISRKHAEIRIEKDGPVIWNLGKKGTYLNGELFHDKRALRHGDTIGIGSENTILFQDQMGTEEIAGPGKNIESGPVENKIPGKRPGRKLRKIVFYTVSAVLFVVLLILIFLQPDSKPASPEQRQKRPPSKSAQTGIKAEPGKNEEMDQARLYSLAALAVRLYQEKEVARRNLYDASLNMKKVCRNADSVKVPPDSLRKWQDLEKKYEAELQENFKKLKSLATVALNQKKNALCKSHLARIMESIPDPGDPRYKWARQNYLSL
jgi:pSer/pThr/pTyr-binding forkhead associated (FHA) protein